MRIGAHRANAHHMPGISATRSTRLLAALLAAAALVLCVFGMPARAHALATQADLYVFQKYQCEWTGLDGDYTYCLESKSGGPLPDPAVSGGWLEDGKFYFTLNANDNDEHNPLLLQVPFENYQLSTSRYDYEMYMVKAPRADFSYKRVYKVASDGSVQEDAEFGDDMRASTLYRVWMWPQYSNQQGGSVVEITCSPGASGRSKVADPGWAVTYVASDQKVVYAGADANAAYAGEVTGAMEPSEWPVGETRALAACGFSRAGYTFAGWNTRPDGTGTSYADQQAYRMTPDGLALYAQWKKNAAPSPDPGPSDPPKPTPPSGPSTQSASGPAAPPVPASPEKTAGTVRYRANDPDSKDGVKPVGSMADSSWTVGESRPLRKNAFSCEGYTFAGWNTRADGSGASYADGQAYAMSQDGLVLYAQWKPAETDADVVETYPASGSAADGGRGSAVGGTRGAASGAASGGGVLGGIARMLSPKTGDEANWLLMCILACTALVSGMVVLLAKRRRKDEDETADACVASAGVAGAGVAGASAGAAGDVECGPRHTVQGGDA